VRRPRTGKGGASLAHLLQVFSDGLHEIGHLPRHRQSKRLAFGPNGLRNPAQVGVDLSQEMQCQRRAIASSSLPVCTKATPRWLWARGSVGTSSSAFFHSTAAAA
jgi:hypothetical protein